MSASPPPSAGARALLAMGILVIVVGDAFLAPLAPG
jgi:hypothetical protein